MILVYDTASSTFAGGIPGDAQAILFYLDGLYANEAAARARFPHLFPSRAIGVTVQGRVGSELDDFEPGNWRGNVGQWVMDSIAKGVWRPIVYADGADMYSTVIPRLEQYFGKPLGNPGPGRRFRLLLARPNGDSTIPSDMDGVQYWWGSIQGGGRVDMDISAVRDDFFQAAPSPKPFPTPTPPEGTVAITGYQSFKAGPQPVAGLAVELADGSVKHIEQESPGSDWWKKPDGTFNWLPLGNPGA